MATMQIKNIPPDVHRVYQRRAAEAGQSLQEYMLALLTEQARRPTQAELFARIAERSGGSVTLEDAVEGIREDRERHDRD